MFARLFAVAVFACLFAVQPAQAAVFTSHSGWFWGSPQPQGNQLNAIEFSGATGYAAGEFGTLLRTANGGISWSGVRTGMTTELTRVEVIDADSIVVASGCALRRSDDGGATIKRVPFTPSEERCSRPLADVSFANADTGYLLLANGGVLKTADGGRSFSPRSAVPGTAQASGPALPTAIAFSTPDVGLATTTAGELYRTDDGGATWERELTAGGSLNALFVSDAAAVAAGENGVFAVSSDAGLTWSRNTGSPPTTLYDFDGVRCGGTGVCLMTTTDGGAVRTADGGRTFSAVAAGVNGLDFATPSHVAAVGPAGLTQVSTDAGATFTAVGSRLAGSGFGRLRATSAGVAHIAGSRGALGRTVDGGASWVNVGVATSEDVLDVSFPTSATGYALDVAGGLFRTDNGGATWGILDTGTTVRPSALAAPDASTALLVGPAGVRRSADGGETFAEVADGDVRGVALGDVDAAGSSVVAFGPADIVVSSDRGASWSEIPRPSRGDIRDLDFQSATAGYALVQGGRLYSTRNGGKRWVESLAVGSHAGTQLAFGDTGHGWLGIAGFTLGGQHVLRTGDGGLSWQPQLLGAGQLRGIAAGDGDTGFAHLLGSGIAQGTQLLATGGGGAAGSPSALSLATRRPVIRKTRTVTVTGTLSRPRGGEDVIVSYRRLSGGRWGHSLVRPDTSGAFSLQRRVARSTVFVAQWRGDAARGGAGSQALVVTRKR